MWRRVINRNGHIFLIMGALLTLILAGCEGENPVSSPGVTGVAVEPFDRDGQIYFFRLPEGFRPVSFEASYWIPETDPNFWRSYYLSKYEIEKRGIEIAKTKVVVNGVEREVYKDEKIVALIVPSKYETWYDQAYGLSLYDHIKMKCEINVRYLRHYYPG